MSGLRQQLDRCLVLYEKLIERIEAGSEQSTVPNSAASGTAALPATTQATEETPPESTCDSGASPGLCGRPWQMI